MKKTVFRDARGFLGTCYSCIFSQLIYWNFSQTEIIVKIDNKCWTISHRDFPYHPVFIHEASQQSFIRQKLSKIGFCLLHFYNYELFTKFLKNQNFLKHQSIYELKNALGKYFNNWIFIKWKGTVAAQFTFLIIKSTSSWHFS